MKKTILRIDQTNLTTENRYVPFALTDVLTEYAGVENQPILHFWQLPNYFILGMKDTRVNDLEKGVQAILKAGYQPVVRNAGGLGVIADAGVLNVSLILPVSDHKISIDAGYDILFEVMKKAYSGNYTIEAKEITDSYCPGKYDLSINDLKFAGIAQRRVKNGIAVMMYLSISGDQEQRGVAVRDFYQAALGEDFGTNGYPSVRPTSMANLSDLIQQELTISAVKQQLATQTANYFQAAIQEQSIETFLAEPLRQAQMQTKMENMKNRNQEIKELIHEHFL